MLREFQEEIKKLKEQLATLGGDNPAILEKLKAKGEMIHNQPIMN